MSVKGALHAPFTRAGAHHLFDVESFVDFTLTQEHK
jgi:hypothetical protein